MKKALAKVSRGWHEARRLRTFHLKSREDSRELDSTQRKSGSRPKLEETDGLKHTCLEGHPKPLSLLTKYFDSASCFISYACAHHASPALTSFCSASLPSSFLPQGLHTCYSSYLECLPSPIPYLHDWFICSQVSVKYHFCLSCLTPPSASHSVTLPCFSVFTALITCWNNLLLLLLTYLESESSN